MNPAPLTSATSWRDTALVLETIADSICNDPTDYGFWVDQPYQKWFGWRVDHDGLFHLYPFDSGNLADIQRQGAELQGVAALVGELTGIGVATSCGRCVCLSVHTPPGWPLVPLADGSTRDLSDVWPSEGALNRAVWRMGERKPM